MHIQRYFFHLVVSHCCCLHYYYRHSHKQFQTMFLFLIIFILFHDPCYYSGVWHLCYSAILTFNIKYMINSLPNYLLSCHICSLSVFDTWFTLFSVFFFFNFSGLNLIASLANLSFSCISSALHLLLL